MNAYNKDEDFVPFIKHLDIDRWKILRCQPFEGNSENEKMLVSDSEWGKFCERNSGINGGKTRRKIYCPLLRDKLQPVFVQHGVYCFHYFFRVFVKVAV